MGRKILMVLLITMLVFSFNKTVQAGNITTDGGSISVPVTYTVENTSFVITVPTTINADVKETSFAIGASKVNIKPEQYIEVFITEGCDKDGKVKLMRQNEAPGTEVSYLESTLSIKGKNIKDNSFRVGYFKDGSDSTKNLDGAVTMSGLNVTASTKAGVYRGNICFTVELRDGANE